MALPSALCTALLLVAVIAALAQGYDSQYKVTDDEEESDEEDRDDRERVDYTKYFGGSGGGGGDGSGGEGSTATSTQDGAGFVQPLDFNGFFGGGEHFGAGGLDGLSSSPTQSFFRPGDATTHGHFAQTSHNAFPPQIEASSTRQNDTGFVQSPNFHSLFDTANSASEDGFRPQNYLRRPFTQPQDSLGHFTPAFSALKYEVDRGVGDAQREEAIASPSRAQAHPVESDDDSYEVDDPEAYSEDNHRAPAQSKTYNTEPHHGKSSYPPGPKVYSKARTPEVLKHPCKHCNDHGRKPSRYFGYENPDIESTEHRPFNKGSSFEGRHSLAQEHRSQKGVPYDTRGIGDPKPYQGYRAAPSQGGRTYEAKNQKKPQVFGDVTHFKPSPSDPYGPKGYPEKPFPNEDIYALPQTANPRLQKQGGESERVLSKSSKRCTKVEKDVNPSDVIRDRFSRQPMTCYVCVDLKTGGNYEQCSYESEPSSKKYFKGSEETYSKGSIGVNPSFRIKRDVISVDQRNRARMRRQSEGYYDDPRESNDGKNYRFGPEYFSDDGIDDADEADEAQENEKQEDGDHSERREEVNGEDEESEEPAETDSSQAQPEQDEQCRKVKKNGLICMVCNNPRTTGTYEQCSYASDPKQNSYSYDTQRTYGTPSNERYRRYTDTILGYPHEDAEKSTSNSNYGKKIGKENRYKPKKSVFDLTRDAFVAEAEGRGKKKSMNKYTGVGLDPFFYGEAEPDVQEEETEEGTNEEQEEQGSDKKEVEEEDEEGASEVSGPETASSEDEPEEEESPTYEDYFLRLFPELAGGKAEAEDEETSATSATEDKQQTDVDKEDTETDDKLIPGFEYQASLPEYFDDSETKKDLDKVMGEFSAKDRSDCKKVTRDKMTCFQCIDKKGMQHEECMFVAASEPKSKHLAYHEVKEFRMKPKKKDPSVEEKLRKTSPATFDTNGTASSIKKRKVPLKKYIPNRTTEPPVTVPSVGEEGVENLSEHQNIPRSKVEIHTNRYYSSTGAPTEDQPSLLRKKRLPEDYESVTPQEVTNSEDKEKQTNTNWEPTEPPAFGEIDGPEGAYSEETEPAFDSVLKISLPKYMLTRSEHEAIFDEVLASG